MKNTADHTALWGDDVLHLSLQADVIYIICHYTEQTTFAIAQPADNILHFTRRDAICEMQLHQDLSITRNETENCWMSSAAEEKQILCGNAFVVWLQVQILELILRLLCFAWISIRAGQCCCDLMLSIKGPTWLQFRVAIYHPLRKWKSILSRAL